MSGSNSSVRAALPEADSPVALTVHSVPAPDLVADRRRTARGRLKMLLVLLVCASPVIASYFTYFVVRPEGRSNYGELVSPPRPLPALLLRTLDGQSVAASSLRGQWLLVAVGPGACDQACEERLFMQRQLREMLGRERDRLDKVWLVTDGAELAPALRQVLEATPPVTILRAERDAVARWLEPAAGQALEGHLYVVDPMGKWMMRPPVDPQPSRLKRDLDRLLRASSSWDTPGR